MSSVLPKSVSRLMRPHEYQAVVTLVLAGLTLVLVGIGLVLEKQGQPVTIQTFAWFFGELASSFAPSSAPFLDENKRNVVFQIGRFVGILTTISGVVLIGGATLGRTFSNLKTRFLRNGHTVVLGDTPLARRLATALRDRGDYVLQIVGEGAEPVPHLKYAREPLGYSFSSLKRAAGLARARRIIVDAGSDAESIAMAKPLYEVLSTMGRLPLETLALRISDPVLADAVTEILAKYGGKVPRPDLFDENRLVAQDTLAAHPPFRIANALKQRQVHALIFGFGDLGEKLLDQVMLTSVAGQMGSPMVTVVDKDPADRELAFRAARPAVMDTLGIEFIGLNLGHDPLEEPASSPGLRQLLRRLKAHPVSAVYLALPSAHETVRALVLLRRLRQREGLLKVPVFFRAKSKSGDSDILASEWHEDKPEEGCVAMSFSNDRLLQEICEPEKRFALARHLHNIYRHSHAVRPEADKPWEELPETYRRASIRAADHLPAKLWTLHVQGPPFDQAARDRLDLLIREGAKNKAVWQLARTEHERWMIERKLDGWRYGKVRNNARQIHNLLVPWAQLKAKPAEVEKDVQQVLAALRAIAETEE